MRDNGVDFSLCFILSSMFAKRYLSSPSPKAKRETNRSLALLVRSYLINVPEGKTVPPKASKPG